MAKRLIDANAYAYPGDLINEPTVDAVEVIRCHNCKNWMYECEDIGLCVADVPDIDGVQRYANDFCSYGERRENAD